MNGRLDVSATQELPVIGYRPAVNSFRAEPDVFDDDPFDEDEPEPQPVFESTPPQEPTKQPRRKVSRWDRPPPPKDWRYFVGGLGQIFISLGILTFGFVGYQLWGTGIETARTQNELGSSFQQQLTAAPPQAEAEVVAVPVAEMPEERRPLDPEIKEVVPVEEQSHLEIVDPGTAIMKIEIPKIGVESYVLPTVSRDDLKKGVGHFPETAMAGQLGNAAFAGHRTTYGGPFYHLDKLEPGDRVVFTRLDGNRYTYAMIDSEVVDPDTYNINGRLNPQISQMTLMTCTPVHSAISRLIIYGELIPSESGPVGEATFYKVRTVTEEVPVTTPAASTDAAAESATTTDPFATDTTHSESTEPAGAADTTIAGTTGADAGGDIASTPAADTGSDAVDGDEVDTEELEAGEDTWSGGWFEDTAAWPQIGIWGVGLLAFYFLFRKISRWTRHYSIGFLLCVAPFLVCLYFFYQNVNRLLPPGI